MSSTTSQSSPSPFYAGEGYKQMQEEPMDTAMDFTFDNLGAPQAAPNRSQGVKQSKSLTRRPSKMMETMNPDISFTASPVQSPCIGVSLVQSGLTDSVHGARFIAGPTSVTSTKRARKDLLIATDLANGCDSQDHGMKQTTPVNASFLALPSPPFTHHPSPYPSSQSHHHSHSSQRSRHGDGHQNCVQCNTPPANCKIPNLSRRSSLAQVMSPPASVGLVKSATSNAIFSSSEHQHLHDTSNPSNMNISDSPKNRLQKRRSSILGASKKQFPASSISINDNTNNTPPDMNGPMRMGTSMTGSSSMFNVHSVMDTSYLPTPTESTFRGVINDSSFPAFPPVGSMMPSLPPTPSSAYFPGVHPFDIPSPSDAARSSQSMVSPLSMSTVTKSATVQYLQQLQSMMHTDFQQGFNSFSSDPFQQQRQKVPGPQRRTSKTKLKRRASAFALGTNINNASLPPSSLPWPSEQGPLLQRQSSLPSTGSQQQRQVPQQSENFSKPYHGPAPCGNPDPLYEYLASPTIVPGLEIIGQDYYGNYVQILPICPETTCSMNQDPVYLNLLQAIYAHTIPFLDLAPGSEEETQRLLNGTPSAIATQSIQPPFKHLLPLNNSSDGQKTTTSRSSNQLCAQGTPRLSTDRSKAYDEHMRSTLTSSMSSPSILATPSSSNNKLLRRASMASISSTGPNSRRSSIVASNSSSSSTTATSSLTNPARKKKNAPRTHPYKSTSSFSEDNSMVTEAILTQVGGVGSIGNANNGAVTDPRRKVAEKTVHMDEREYAEHYSKHQQSMNKSASNSSLCLAQTLATSMVGSSLSSIDPSSLMASSISAPSITNATVSATGASSALESIAAADFIRALSECNGGMGDLGLSHSSSSGLKAKNDHMSLAEQEELVSLENLMMMDSTTAAAVQAAASATAWPNWFDLNQLEQDVCDPTHRDFEGMPLSTSSTLASFQGVRSNSTTQLLLSSSTNLAMLDDATVPLESSSGSLAPSTDMNTQSTSQILMFDQSQQQKPNEDKAMELASPLSPSSTNSLRSSMDSQDGTTSQASSSVPVNNLALPYSSSLLTVLPFSAQHSHPIFPTRGNRRSGWYRSKSVASQALSEITGVDYTTTCWYDVEQLQNVVRDSISFQENLGSKSLEDLTEPATEDASSKE
ncbi:hypothetical protein MVEG_05291 [Podila verticillata NRRL 6337]|nr:hypothetical protein MVEG_05291 [Podila verticillata NRRL 6337]